MVVTLNERKVIYPWVGKCVNDGNTAIVLFIDVSEAILLESDASADEEYMGTITDVWDESEFTPCSVTISSL